MNNQNNNELTLLLNKISYQGKGINAYEFIDPEGKGLPPFTAGSHLDVKISSKYTRQYSLSNDPSETHRYVIAVLKDENGRGGSKALHNELKVQDLVTVSAPRNHFEISPETKRAILIAGGIGITPIKSMAHTFKKNNIPFELHYCAREMTYVAFKEELDELNDNNLFFHFDGIDPSKRLDVVSLLQNQNDGDHLYFCGPPGFMEACKSASAHWQDGTVHFEHFQAPVKEKAISAENQSGNYTIEIKTSGLTINASKEDTVLEALQAAGIPLETSCESGLCGACKIGYEDGDIDHQDFILGEDERSHYLTACVSKVISDSVTLDL